MKKPSTGSESGQSVVLIAFFLVGVIGFVGLVTDGGRAYAARRQSQNASDGASFAGARVLSARANSSASTEQEILSAVNTIATANGIASTSDVQAYFLNSSNNQIGAQIGLNGGIPGSATGVRVYTRIQFTPFLITVVNGGGPVTVRTIASAQTGEPSEFENLMPMTLIDQTFIYDKPYQLFGNKEGSGAFQWLSYDCESSNPDLIAYLGVIPTKWSGIVEVGDFVCNGPGVQNSNAVNDELDKWLAFTDPKKRYWTIPIYDYTVASGSNLQYHVVHFAVFEFDGYNFNGSNKFVMGRFVRFGKLGHVTTPGTCNTTGVNICGISLFE